MSKKIAFIGAGLVYALAAVSSFAQSAAPLIQAPAGSVNANVKVQSIPQLIVNLMFALATFLAIAYLMYGGIKWITSRGDKVAVESARKHIVAAIIGLVVVAGTFFILQFVFTVLGADNPLKSGFTLPTLQSSPTP